MDYHYTDAPVAALYNAVAKDGRSELTGVSYSQIALEFDGEGILDIDDKDRQVAKNLLDWALEWEDHSHWTRVLVNLRLPGREKLAKFDVDGNSYQLFHLGSHLNMTVNIASVNLESFGESVAASQDILFRASSFAGVQSGDITMVIGWAFLPWELMSDNGDVEERLVEY